MRRFSRWMGAPAGAAKRPAFIHVPKTGGTYLMQSESSDGPVVEGVCSFGHSYVIDREEDLNPVYLRHNRQLAREAVVPRTFAKDRFVFSTVRNIFGWLVSYAGHAAGWNPKYEASRHYDHASALKGFDYLVKVIANREDQWPNRKLIHCQLFSSGKDLIVDHVNHQESLDDDLAGLASKLGIGCQKKGAQRLGNGKDYREYYTDELIEIVASTWNRELELFGYTFDGCERECAVIKGAVAKEQKAAIKYCWNKDTLTIAGCEVPRR